MQVVLDQSQEVLRAAGGVLICRTHHGFVCANAGVDASNTASAEALIVLPRDPDASARRLRARLRELTGARVARADNRQLRPCLAPRAVRRRDRLRRPAATRRLARTHRQRRPAAARHVAGRRRCDRRHRRPRARQGLPRAGCDPRRAWSGSSLPRTARARPRCCARWRRTCSARAPAPLGRLPAGPPPVGYARAARSRGAAATRARDRRAATADVGAVRARGAR